MKTLRTTSILALFIISTSCATLLTGTRQKVAIDSNPQGAEIVIDGQKLGVTPAKIKVDREIDALLYGGKEIQLVLEGYRSLGYEMDARLNLVSIINHFNPLFWGIDIATGAVTKYDNYYNFKLMPLEGKASNPYTTNNMDKYEKLLHLKKLLEEGVITQEEFEKEKAKILEE